MIHKIVETGKKDEKCNNLLKYSCYACYQDYLFSYFAKLDMLITTIGIKTIGTGMLGAIFEIEIVLIKKNFCFSLKGPGTTPIYILSFSMLTMPEMT